MRFLFSYSKISKRLEGVSYKVFLVNHTACKSTEDLLHVHYNRIFKKSGVPDRRTRICKSFHFDPSRYRDVIHTTSNGICEEDSKQNGINHALQGDPIGCRTGNGEKVAKQSQVRKSTQLLFSFPPFPVRHPIGSPCTPNMTQLGHHHIFIINVSQFFL